jgi:spore protease
MSKLIVVILMKFRTDFADELKFNDKKEFSKQIKKYKNCKMTTINILNDKNQFKKEKGRYVSIDFNNLMDKPIRSEVEKLLISALNDLYKINNKDKILIVGLGNQKILADSLGPKVADKIVVTNHLFKVLNIKENVNRVCVFTPKVMGQTGLESADLVDSVAKLFKPNIIIVIDALASLSIDRINKTIQVQRIRKKTDKIQQCKLACRIGKSIYAY